MKHFGPEVWFDFVRGLAPPDVAALMQRHLDEGCEQCSKICETWQAVQDIARREAASEPPENAVRMVNKAFIDQVGRQTSTTARKALLIFDTFLQPAPAGVRSSVVSARQLLFRAGTFLIDVRIEPQPAGSEVFLAGQVVNSKEWDTEIDGVQVSLLSEKRLVAKTAANPFGEFHLEFTAGKNLRLQLEVPGHKAIGIPLPDPETAAEELPS